MTTGNSPHFVRTVATPKKCKLRKKATPVCTTSPAHIYNRIRNALKSCMTKFRRNIVGAVKMKVENDIVTMQDRNEVLRNPKSQRRQVEDIENECEQKNMTINPDRLSSGAEYERISSIIQTEEILSEFEKVNAIAAIVSKNKLASAQNADREATGIKTAVKGEPFDENYRAQEIRRYSRAARRYTVEQNDALCFKKYSRGKLLRLPYIPTELRGLLIKEVQDDPVKGNHTRELRTCLKLADAVSWPSMREDITDYVKTCRKCLEHKQTNITKYGKMQPEKSVSKLMKKICTDVYGPLNINGQKLYVLTMIGKLSKYTWMRCTKNVNTSTVTQLLDEIIANYPAPQTLHTDQAAYFTSNELEAHYQQ